MTYIPEQTQIRLDEPIGVAEYELNVTKSGWGYTFFRTEAEGDFLSVEKERVSEHDFLGNSFRMVYYVDSEKLHAGRNFGSLRIYNAYMELVIPVMVSCSTRRQRTFGLGREKKRILLELMEHYCNYRGKKISTRIWMSETEKLVERLSAMDGKDIQTKLFQAQLYLTQERYKEAQNLLERIAEEVDLEQYKPEIGCYYLYLTTLLSDDEEYVDRVASRVARVYRANPGNWRIAWLMLYLSDEYVKSFSRRWLLLEEQFTRNCASPVLYVEAWHLLEMNPTLLMKLGAFEIQVLNFAAKRELLSQDIVVQIRYQIQKLKEYSEQAFYILKECYEKFPDNETLQAICTLLIKGNKTDSRYFEWYSMGVEQELRITKLYEYYMMALPEDYEGEIPKMVLMYFAYQSDLDYRKNAFLYEYVYRRREEQPEYYIKYCERIEQFALAQVQKGRINKELAYLYKHILKPGVLNEERAVALLPILFTYCIETENPSIRQVIVRYAVTRSEYSYPVSAGRAYVPIYGEDYKVLLEDADGCRYTVSVPYRMERLMESGELVKAVGAYVEKQEGLDIYLCESNRTHLEISGENVHSLRHIEASEQMEVAQRNEICLKLIHYYYEQDDMQALDEYLEQISPEDKKVQERKEILRFLVLRGMYDKALAWIKRYGALGSETKTLVRLCSRLIARDGNIEEEELTKLVYYVFENGKYDGNLLSYLVCFYRGTMRRLRDIWKAAQDFEVDTYVMCERMLIQMLCTGTFIDERMSIFREYIAGGAKMEVELAFLSKCSYDYFMKDKVADAFVFTDMLRVYERGEPLKKICRLAFLKYYAKHKDAITPKVRIAVQSLLDELLKADMCFAFYKEYVKEIPQMARYADKTIVEYRTRNTGRVVIHYMIEKGAYTQREYQQEEMREMYKGVYAKPFVLFFGENLKYYITEETDRKEQVTESTSVSRGEVVHGEESRFALINEILEGQALQNYDTVDRLLENYYKKEHMISRIFRLR